MAYHETFAVYKAKGGSGPRLTASEFRIYMDTYIEMLAKKQIDDFCATLVGHKPDLEPTKAFIRALTGQEDELDTACLAHWLWQVKRKVAGLKTKYELFLIVQGRQGVGKSWAVMELLNPVSLISFNGGSVADVASKENAFKLAQYYICFLDEMEKASKADKEALKRVVTQREIEYRQLYTQLSRRTEATCSFIGTSNPDIQTMISDEEMRRFYQITVDKPTDQAAIKRIDYQALWNGIDETREDGYMTEEIMSKLRVTQSRYTTASPVTTFIEEMQLRPNGDYVEVDCRDLWHHFKEFDMEFKLLTKWEHMSYTKFLHQLRGNGLKTVQKRIGQQKPSYAWINPSSTIARNLGGSNGTVLQMPIRTTGNS
jgi:hypothetical protein